MEGLRDPDLVLPEVETCFERSNVTVYVPVNDRAGPSAATLQSCPEISRSKQPRSFPRFWVGSEACFLHWPNADGTEVHFAALDRVCRKVTRLGHSSSLVSMWAAGNTEPPLDIPKHLVRDDLQADWQVRAFSAGMLDMLRERFGEEPRRRHAALTTKIDDLKAEKKAATGKGAKERRGKIDEQLTVFESELSSLVTRPPVRPATGLWSGYRRRDRAPRVPEDDGNTFDRDILVLSQVAGPRLPVVSTLAITKALRQTIMISTAQPVPSWVSGHTPEGQSLRDGSGHLALVPLPFVGRDHADGHLLGVALSLSPIHSVRGARTRIKQFARRRGRQAEINRARARSSRARGTFNERDGTSDEPRSSPSNGPQ